MSIEFKKLTTFGTGSKEYVRCVGNYYGQTPYSPNVRTLIYGWIVMYE